MYNLLIRLSPDHPDLLVLQDTPVLREMLVPQVTLELPAPLASPDPLVLTAPLVTLVLKEVRQKLHFFFKKYHLFLIFPYRCWTPRRPWPAWFPWLPWR